MTPTYQKKTYLIDTSFLLAYQNRDNKQLMDDCRTTIDILKEEEYPRIIVTDLIFCEYSSYIWHALRKNRKLAIERIEEVIENFEIEFIDSNIFKAAFDLFLRKNREGHAWSLVDCSSFIFMRERRRKIYKDNRIDIRHALAIDEHFEQAQKEFGFLAFKI